MNGVTADGGVVVGSAAQLAAEASLALACEQELEAMGGASTLEEDALTLAAASEVLSEVEEECEPCDTGDEVCVVPNPERVDRRRRGKPISAVGRGAVVSHLSQTHPAGGAEAVLAPARAAGEIWG